MNIDLKNVLIYIKPGPTDMRKQINSLSVFVAEEMNFDPLNGSLYIFCSKNRRCIKILYWDTNGFCLWQKRLEKENFPWPRNSDEAYEITREQLLMLLHGIDFFRAHKKLIFSAVS